MRLADGRQYTKIAQSENKTLRNIGTFFKGRIGSSFLSFGSVFVAAAVSPYIKVGDTFIIGGFRLFRHCPT